MASNRLNLNFMQTPIAFGHGVGAGEQAVGQAVLIFSSSAVLWLVVATATNESHFHSICNVNVHSDERRYEYVVHGTQCSMRYELSKIITIILAKVIIRYELWIHYRSCRHHSNIGHHNITILIIQRGKHGDSNLIEYITFRKYIYAHIWYI